MSVVFVGTVGLLALWNANDQWHSAAQEAFGDITGSEATLLTTTFVLLECGNDEQQRSDPEPNGRAIGAHERGAGSTPDAGVPSAFTAAASRMTSGLIAGDAPRSFRL